jgi:hypothetical protein
MQCGSQLGHAPGKFGVVGHDVLAAEKGWRIRRTAGRANQPLRKVHKQLSRLIDPNNEEPF